MLPLPSYVLPDSAAPTLHAPPLPLPPGAAGVPTVPLSRRGGVALDQAYPMHLLDAETEHEVPLEGALKFVARVSPRGQVPPSGAFVEGRQRAGPARSINHSCCPNLW